MGKRTREVPRSMIAIDKLLATGDSIFSDNYQ